MKKLLILLSALLVFLCGCSSKNDVDEENTFTVASFSYANDRANYENKPGVKTSGFRNVEAKHIADIKELMELAKDECDIDYDMIVFSHDEEADIYKFTFSTEEVVEDSYGTMDVYITKDGVTLMTIYTERE